MAKPERPHEYRVLNRRQRFVGRVFEVVTDTVTMPGGGSADRDYVRHIGAVGVAALDPQGRVALVRQYRHPVGWAMWELPAGLNDMAGEDPLDTARRELAEEAEVTAQQWHLLLDLHTSPGASDERIRIYLARDLAPAAGSPHRSDEEAEMTTAWWPLDDAVELALSGKITNGPAVAGLLAAQRARDTGWVALRSADAPAPDGSLVPKD
ncbi:MAG: NUDIX domain-containing protein [Micromonosporaceae bacterium]